MSKPTDAEYLDNTQDMMDDLVNDPPEGMGNPKDVWDSLTDEINKHGEGVTAMPDSVRKSLGLPSNAEVNADLRYRRKCDVDSI